MTLTEPSLVLTFNDQQIQDSNQVVLSQYIVKDSVKLRYQLLDGLMSSSNQVTLQLTRNCPSTADIIKTDKDVHVILKDGAQTLFTGYLSNNHNWSLTAHGEQAFNITLESIGTRRLTLPFIESGYHLFDCSADSAIRAICSSVGITVSPLIPVVTDNVFKVVEASQTAKDILSKLVYELGYVYCFDNLGRLSLYKVDCTSVTGIRTLDGDDLVCKSGKAVNLSRKIKQYDSSHITFSELGRSEDYLVYRNTTNQDEMHPYCNFELPSGGHFDGTEIYTAYEWSEELFDEFREPALVGACNADSETRIVGSNDILAVYNIRCASEQEAGVTCNITGVGGLYLSIDAHNDSNRSASITRLDAYGDIVYQKSTGVVRGGFGGNVLSEELEYVHDRSLAQKHANLLSEYHKYCSSRYTFYLREDLELGTIVRLHDNVFSGLDVNVLLVSKEVSTSSDVVSYSAVGISVFDLNRELYHRTTDRQRTSLIGPKGSKGDSGNSFNAYVDRDVIDCYSNRTPVDTTPVRLTVNLINSTSIPALTVAGKSAEMTLDSSTVNLRSWIYEIDPNLNGSDICQLCVSVNGLTWTSTLSKNVPNDSLEPDIFIPLDYVLVKQYCYGSSKGPDPQWVSDSSADLEDASDLVSDIYWVDAVDGQCPLKPRAGLYIWMRQGVYDPSIATEPEEWTISLHDTPYLRFDFTISQRSYVRDLRDIYTINEIYIYPNLFGYDESSLIVSASNKNEALPFDKNYNRYVLSFNVCDAPAGVVTITAYLGSKQWSVDLRCNDVTEHNKYFGLNSSVPDYVVLDGDSYTINNASSSDHMRVMVYSETDKAWHYLSDPNLNLDSTTVSEISAKALMDVLSNIQIGTLTQSDYAYFNTIIAGVVTADFIGAKQINIQEQGYICGGEVNPSQAAGERVSNQGFIIDSNGIIEAYQAILKQAKVVGQMDFSDADILHPCFKTVPAVGTDLTTYGIPSPTHWYDGDVSFSSISENVITAVSSSYFGSSTISHICRATNVSTRLIADNTTLQQGSVNGVSDPVSFTIDYGGSYYLSCALSTLIPRFETLAGSAYANVNGTRVLTESRIGETSGVTVSLKKGDVVTFGSGYKDSSIGTGVNTYALTARSVTLKTEGITETGRWYQISNQWHKVGSAYHPKSQRMYINGIFDSDTRIRYLYLNDIVPNYMSSLENGKVYNVTGSMTINGNTTLTPAFITKNGSTGTLICFDTNATKYELSLSNQVLYWLTGSLKVVSSARGLQTKAIYPDTTLSYDLGSYDLQFRNVYCQAVNQSSKRELKTNIEPFTDNALELINSVDVMKYNFKSDCVDVPKERIIDYIGFIADDTDQRLSGKQHDKFLEINCIGVLIKAVQELSAKVKQLEEEKENGKEVDK